MTKDITPVPVSARPHPRVDLCVTLYDYREDGTVDVVISREDAVSLVRLLDEWLGADEQ